MKGIKENNKQENEKQQLTGLDGIKALQQMKGGF